LVCAFPYYQGFRRSITVVILGFVELAEAIEVLISLPSLLLNYGHPVLTV
jgi:hypothetical protein